MAPRFAFYDFDGTLVSSNVVTQYAWYARRLPSRWRAAAKTARLAAMVPLLFGLDLYSRRLFNEVFYREYRGIPREWLVEMAESLFESVIRPAVYPGARPLVEADRAAGFQTVLVTGSLDFALAPVIPYFGFDHVIANSMRFEGGLATGDIVPPLIAGREKVEAMLSLCRQYNVESVQSKAYSDSMSDLPMLEAVGLPAAVNPGRRLRRIARERGWPAMDLK
ncbi:MAG: HAD-IB family hydrolase [Bryobacteraceae bacterium]|nr:HAD-IB family hydrolase [Bryobacteraceae bacterium]